MVVLSLSLSPLTAHRPPPQSYAGSHTIGPFRDFTAVIGANGSGKSNFMDAIGFVLGVKSRKLRGQKLKDLIYRGGAVEGPPDSGAAAADPGYGASVKLVYEVGDGEVEGMAEGEELHFSRVITPQGNCEYYVGEARRRREVRWSQYEDELGRIGVLVKARNFLVFQGDVEMIASKSNELSSLFEQISGSGELAERYEEARKEKDAAEENAISSSEKKKAAKAERKQVKEQKDEAEQFRRKQNELATTQTEFYLIQLYHLDREMRERDGEVNFLNADLADAARREKKAEDLLKKVKKDLAGLNRAQSKAESARDAARKAHRDSRANALRLREEISALESQVEEGQAAVAAVAADAEAQRKSSLALEAEMQRLRAKEAELAAVEDTGGGAAGLDPAKLAEYQELKARSMAATQTQREKATSLQLAASADGARLDAVRNQARELQSRIEAHEAVASQYESRKVAMAAAGVAARSEQAAVERELAVLDAKAESERQQAVQVEAELRKVREELGDVKEQRRAGRAEQSMNDCLDTLKRLFPGVRGRLVDLCRPSSNKYKMAATVAAGRWMDAIVVDTQATGFDCIQYMRDQRVGTATFIPLDSIKTKPVMERLRGLGARYRLCVDVLVPKSGSADIARALQFAVGSTVIADSLDDARELCFSKGERVKCVTLRGAVISKSGTMTGGSSHKDLERAARWGEKDAEDLRKRREELESLAATLSRGHRVASHRTELQTRGRGLENRATSCDVDLQHCEGKLKEMRRLIQVAQAELQSLKQEEATLDASFQAKEMEASNAQRELEDLENQIFADFTAGLGVSSVKDFEEGQLKDIQGLMRRRLKVREHLTKLEAQRDYEQGRDFTTPLAKLEATVASRRDELAELQRSLEQTRAGEGTLLTHVEAAEEKLDLAKEAVAEKAAEVKAAQLERGKQSKLRAESSKKVTAEESALERLRAQLHEVLQKAQVDEVELPVKDGARQSDDEEGDEESSEEGSMGGRGTKRRAQDAPPSSSSGASSSMHFSQSDSRTVQADDAAAHRIDLSRLRKHRTVKDKAELEDILSRYLSQMAALQAEMDRLQPNLKAAEMLQSVQERLKETDASFEDAKNRAQAAAAEFERIKQERADLFLAAFNHVASNVNAIYKELTKSETYPPGGTAYLDLAGDNREEPYLSGILFNATPPKKRWRGFDQLSGGEKTVAALALLFAIHGFKAAPFFVMDEIDAALDKDNVARVCRYIKHRAEDGSMQSIVISLKEDFFDQADALVGICRDVGSSSSRVLTLDLQAFDEQADTHRPAAAF